jgi:hypothetical protein
VEGDVMRSESGEVDEGGDDVEIIEEDDEEEGVDDQLPSPLSTNRLILLTFSSLDEEVEDDGLL